MSDSIADKILEWFADKIAPWILVAMIIVALIVGGLFFVGSFYSGSIKLEDVTDGIIIGKYYEPSGFVGIAGKGGHYVPEHWTVVIGGQRPNGGTYGTCHYWVSKSYFDESHKGDEVHFSK